MNEILIPIIIYFVIPILGFVFYIYLSRKFKQENPELANTNELFFLFSSYIGLLLILLTELLWVWSGMASIGALFVFIFAPIIIAYIIFRTKRKDNINRYDILVLKLAKLYFFVLAASILLLFIYS